MCYADILEPTQLTSDLRDRVCGRTSWISGSGHLAAADDWQTRDFIAFFAR